VIVGSLVVGAAACAKSPSSIAPMAVSSSEYAHMNCATLAFHHMNASAKLESASERQNSAQAMDAVGVFLVLIPPSALVGDAEGEVALHKGEKVAIERTMTTKGCGLGMG
jgi:hypothetical protein